MAFSESHQSEGAHRFILVTADSEELLKGYFEKTALYNYRDLYLLQFQEVHRCPGALSAEY